MTLFFSLKDCSLGHVLVAQSPLGVLAVMLGDKTEPLVLELQNHFPQAQLVAADRDQERIASEVISLIEDPYIQPTLPLDIHGTPFQLQVWRALQNIPPGKTVSYNEIAQQIDSPRAVRAVANACAANKLAVIIPCHRVIRSDGSLGGYRWGMERKQKMLEIEHHRAHLS